MDLQLTGKKALVTGGSRGIGKATALELAREGCSVAIGSRNEGPLRQAADDIFRQTGTRVVPIPVNTADPASIKAFVSSAVEQLGGVDILINNAARTGGAREEADVYDETDEEQMIEDFREKVVGYLRCARAVAPHMKAAGWGRIINVSGGAGRFRGGLISAGVRNRSINHMTVSLANALGPYGINVVCVSPGTVVNERQMELHRQAAEREGTKLEERIQQWADRTMLLKRLALPEDLAVVTAFLCSPRSWLINGATIEANGGSSPDVRYDQKLDPWGAGILR